MLGQPLSHCQFIVYWLLYHCRYQHRATTTHPTSNCFVVSFLLAQAGCLSSWWAIITSTASDDGDHCNDGEDGGNVFVVVLVVVITLPQQMLNLFPSLNSSSSPSSPMEWYHDHISFLLQTRMMTAAVPSLLLLLQLLFFLVQVVCVLRVDLNYQSKIIIIIKAVLGKETHN